jgi:hypothetical protein
METELKILGDGYLSSKGQAEAQRIVAENQGGFEALLQSINAFRSFAVSCEVVRQETKTEKQKAIALVLAARLLEVTEAAYVTMQHGMSTEANSLFRIFLDAYFVLGNICSNPDFVAQYFQSDEANRLKLINSVSKHTDELFQQVNDGISEEHKAELKARVESEKIQAFDSYNYAAKIGCEKIYDSMYRIASAAIHTTPRALGSYSEENDKGILISVRDGPSRDQIPQRLHDFAHFTIKALSGLQEVFGCSNQENINRLSEKLQQVPKSET